jgi:hypothetical protein
MLSRAEPNWRYEPTVGDIGVTVLDKCDDEHSFVIADIYTDMMLVPADDRTVNWTGSDDGSLTVNGDDAVGDQKEYDLRDAAKLFRTETFMGNRDGEETGICIDHASRYNCYFRVVSDLAT